MDNAPLVPLIILGVVATGIMFFVIRDTWQRPAAFWLFAASTLIAGWVPAGLAALGWDELSVIWVSVRILPMVALISLAVWRFDARHQRG